MMKWTGLACVTLLFICTATVVPATAALKFITDKILLDVYGQPNEQGDVMLKILSGTEIEIIETRGDYVKIKNRDTKTGWIHNKYLSNEQPSQLAYLQIQKKYNLATAQLAKLENQRDQSRDYQQTNKAYSQLKKQHQNLEKEFHDVKVALTEKTDALNKTNSTIVMLTDEIATTKSSGIKKQKLMSARSINPPIPHAFTLSIAWTAAAILLALAGGFLFGIKWIDNRIAKKHGGVRIS